MVPDGWQIKTLGSISKISSGGTPRRERNDYWEGDVPWVTTAEVNLNVIYDTQQKITQLGLESSSAKLYPKETILMAMYGQGKTRGKVAVLGIEASTNQACAAIQLNPRYDCKFYYLFLESQYEAIRNISNSGGQENLSAALVKSIKVPVPPYVEQTKIAQILSTWDKAIATVEQLIENSQQQKKALMQQLLTGKKRFSSFSAQWDKVALGEISYITTGDSNREDSDLEAAYTFFDRSEDIRKSSRYLFDKEAVIVPGEGQQFVPKYFKGKFDLHQRTYAIMDFDNERVLGKFIYYHIQYFKYYLLSQAVGSTVKSLRLPMFQKMPILLPPLKEQKAISSLLSNTDLETTLLEEKLGRLKQEKKSLMQQLLTGKRRVTIDAAETSV